MGSGVYVGYLMISHFRARDEEDEEIKYESDMTGEWVDVPGYKDRQFKINGFTLPRRFVKNLGAIKEFKTESSDIWICSFPKSGRSDSQARF